VDRGWFTDRSCGARGAGENRELARCARDPLRARRAADAQARRSQLPARMNHRARCLQVALLLLSLSITVAGCSGTGGDGDVGSSSAASTSAANEKQAYEFFVAKGLEDLQSSGILGNLMQESSVQPGAIQFGGGPGRGIAQWSVGGRWDTSFHDNVVWYAGTKGMSPWSLELQLDFIWYELTTFGYGFSALRGTRTVADATVVFQDDYEICGTCDQTTRINYADSIYSERLHWGEPIVGPAGKCIDDRGAGTADGTPIQLYDCNGTNAQVWTANSNGSFGALGKCMDVTHGGTTDGTLIQLYTCNGTGSQVWQPESNGSLRNPQSGKCLDLPGGDTDNGAQLQIYTCNGTGSQVWHVL